MEGINNYDEELLKIFKTKDIPYIVVYNKVDLIDENKKKELESKLDDTSKKNFLL